MERATPNSVIVTSVSFIPEHWEEMKREADQFHGGNFSALVRYIWRTHQQRRTSDALAKEGVKAAVIEILKDPAFMRAIIGTIANIKNENQ